MFLPDGNSKIIDIHTHIVYGIDDGSQDFEMSLSLLDMACKQGVRGIFCTNHSYFLEYCCNEYYSRYEKLAAAAAKMYPELSLYQGCEVECHQETMPRIIRNIQNRILPTMNGTEYVLAEFVPHRTHGTKEMRFCLEYLLDKGYKPIIAHAERYLRIFDDPLEDILKMKEFGCMVQINLYSVEEESGVRKELANLFLKNFLVDFVGTDTHNLFYKAPAAAVGAEALRKQYGDEYADKVLFGNAEELLIKR